MSETTNQDIRDLIIALDRKVDTRFAEMEVRFVEVKAEIRLVEEKLTGKINQVEEKLTGRINQVEEKLTGKINQVEEKLTGRINQVEEKLTGIDKRVGNEELLSRGVFITIMGGVITGLTKLFFFS